MANDTRPAISKHLLVVTTDQVNTLQLGLIELIANQPVYQGAAVQLLEELHGVEHRDYVAAGAAGEGSCR